MEFEKLLNHYMEVLNCTSKELSARSELSPPIISRYKNGNRKPAPDSEQLHSLVRGLALIAQEKGVSQLTQESLLSEFTASLSMESEQFENFYKNLDQLLDTQNVSMKQLSASIHLDQSFLYKIRQGQRRPYDIADFSAIVSHYIVQNHSSGEDRLKLASLLGCDADRMAYGSELEKALVNHLTFFPSGESEESFESIGSFVRKMDEFNLDEFIRTIHFDEMKVPKLPFYLPAAKSYHGVEEMRKGELDFFKSTILSKSMEPIFMYNEMPMADTAEDMDFNRKWMFAIAMSIKKGLHMNVIHNLDRPFDELMLGLEAWLPIYMTGQISPYYFAEGPGKLYHHMDYVSGSVALTGECLEGHHNDGKYDLITNKDELAYYKKKAGILLSKASPLMEIYDAGRAKEYNAFAIADAGIGGNRHHILSSFPIYTMSEELLDKICARSSLTEADALTVKEYYMRQKQYISQKLTGGLVLDEIMIPSKEEFTKYPMHLDLSGCFLDTPLLYTYEEMLTHLEQTKEFAKTHKTYTLQITDVTAFRNMHLLILEGKYVVMSKVKAPAIHFVVRHPTLVHALQHFKIAVIE